MSMFDVNETAIDEHLLEVQEWMIEHGYEPATIRREGVKVSPDTGAVQFDQYRYDDAGRMIVSPVTDEVEVTTVMIATPIRPFPVQP